MKLSRSLFVAPVLLLALAGCSASAYVYVSVPTKDVAAGAAKILQKQVDTKETPAIDCGKGDTDLIVGKKLDCELTDPVDGSVYDTVVTITSVKGTSYNVDVKVADKAKGDTNSPTVPASDVDTLAANALAQQGQTYTIDCGAQDLPIVEGNIFDCGATDSTGTYKTTVTVTSVQGSDYNIRVQVSTTPVG